MFPYYHFQAQQILPGVRFRSYATYNPDLAWGAFPPFHRHTFTYLFGQGTQDNGILSSFVEMGRPLGPIPILIAVHS